MTDTALARGVDRTEPAITGRPRKRHARDGWLHRAGIAAPGVAVTMLDAPVSSLRYKGFAAFTRTHVTLEFEVSEQRVKAEDPAFGNVRAIVQDAVWRLFPDLAARAEQREPTGLMSSGAQFLLRGQIVDDPGLIETTLRLAVPMSDPFGQRAANLVRRDTPEANRRVNDRQIAWFDRPADAGLISKPLKTGLVTNAESRFPGLAGLKGALWGSFHTLPVCFVIAFPVGIATPIYLEEFAPKNRLTELIEINIDNRAAVPSVVLGPLALAMFLGWFGLQRSAPLVGGLTLALMTLPTIITATRSAVKAVPPSIRKAALGLGASATNCVLLPFLVITNAAAIYRRRRFERRW